ncbi:hypothetical protein OUZ56_026613 [Daphnia magna]|uniref:THAP-type domain-containing protein n=1 Tax=Daphnia magna TaxID=35525 RepID=A0ABQ9ZMD3_9CRUS|nr:hypothetical protein OUZ56_026613 [Daphnia magna]
MVRTCAAPGCRTGYPLKKGEANQVKPKRALFAAQNEKEFSYVCELHFIQEDFQNSYSGLCNGVPSDVTALQTVNKHLRPGAVPFLWPGCPEYLSNKEKPKRKSPKERVLPSPKATIFDSESEEPYYFKREIVAGGHVCIWKQTWLPAAKAILKHQANGSNEMSTTTTFLQLFRMIALYYPGKKILRGANIDDESD